MFVQVSTVIVDLYGVTSIWRTVNSLLKGLGHAILGNFSAGQFVIELIAISNNSLNLQNNLKQTQQSQQEPWMGKIGED